MRYYLKARSGVCYDKTGITYPDTQPIDFKALIGSVALVDKPKITWVKMFGYYNQPHVLIFRDEQVDVTLLEGLLNTVAPNSFMVLSHWESDNDDLTAPQGPDTL